MSTTEFGDIFHSGEQGKLRIGASGISWRGTEDGRIVNVPAGDLKWIEWLRVARNFQLRVGLKGDRRREAFDGFLRQDQETLAGLCKTLFSLTLETKEISFKGWNWGSVDFRGQDLAMEVSNRTAFEIPLSTVANSNIAGKTEVSLEFFLPDSAKRDKRRAPDELVEMRFYIPGAHVKGDEDGANGDSTVINADEDQSAAQVFHDTIKEKADIGQVTGEGIIVFNEVLVTTPRGRYDIDMFPNFLRLHGKTYDYKVPYNTISRLFLLPKPDDQYVSFVVQLDPPIRQGQTRYPFLVMLFGKDEEMQAVLAMDEATIQEKYEGKLEKTYSAPTFQVVSSVFRGLSGKKILTPSQNFAPGGEPGHAVKSNLKAVQGELYFLEKSLFFLSKQPVLIQLSDVHTAVFSRLGGGMASVKTFDLRITQKMGPEITFSSIAKEEKDQIDTFLSSKKVRVKNEVADDAIMAVDLGSDDDEEMHSIASSESEKPKRSGGGGGGGGDDDEDSSEDEDFQASTSDEGSPTDSSEDSDDDGSDAEDSPKKKAPAKKKGSASPPPKKKAVKGGDVDRDEKPKAKSKPKPKPAPKGDDDDEGPGPAKKKKRVE